MSDRIPPTPTLPPSLDRDLPLTALQKATLTRSLLSPSGGYYLQQLVCDWPGALDVAAWQRAWEAVAARHNVLRVRFNWHRSGDATQRFADHVTVALTVEEEDGASTQGRGRDAMLSEFLDADRRAGFDLSIAPLWRLKVFRWSDASATTVWTFHHGLLDGRSHTIVWREVESLYRGILAGPPARLPAARSFREFLDWRQQAPTDGAAAYWRGRMSGFQGTVGLPTTALAQESAMDDGPQASESIALDSGTTSRLRSGAQRHDVTLNNLVQGAWALALARYNGVEEVSFGVVRACRHWTAERPDERVGMFINTVPFRVDASPGQNVGAWLRGLRRQQFEGRAGEHGSMEQIRDWCGIPRGTRLFRTALMFEEKDPSAGLASDAPQVRLLEKTDLLTLTAYAGAELTLTLDYSPCRHSATQARRVVEHLATLLRELGAAPAEQTLCNIRMSTEDERRLVLGEWQGRITEGPELPLHRVLETVAQQMPRAPALEWLGVAIDYAELHRRANQLARRLRQFGGPGDRVVVALDRSHEQIIAWLAALKAGLVYAPVDPWSPSARLEFYLDDLQPTVVLTQSAFLPHLPVGGLRVVIVDDAGERATLDQLDGTNLAIDPAADAPINLLYTSGSTGVPKAAINSLGGLDNFANHLRHDLDIRPGDRVLQSSATSFDASLFDFVAALQTGATLVLVPSEDLRPGPGLASLLVRLRISVVLLTPTVMRSTPVPPSPTVRLLVSAGEPLTAELLALWAPGRRVFNVCGPTECSVWFHFEESRPNGHQPAIGRLIQNCRGYILDEHLQPAPVGVPGELCLAGAGVGLGYWRRPELTEAHYLPDPFDRRNGARLYRTGDRVRWLADGRVEFLGRLDFQVKVQGVRIELGEIEVALRSHPAVLDAVLVQHEDRLLAWLVPRGEKPPANALRAWISDRIPLLFLPAVLQWVTEFPRTRTGKVDRGTLLAEWIAIQSPLDGTTAAGQPSEDERRRLRGIIEERNQTARPFPLEKSVVDFFSEQVRLQPDAPALKAGDTIISYRTLEQRADRVARHLARQSLQSEAVVALRFRRSIAFVVAALGVLKAGGSYLPLEAGIPDARLEQLLADSGARHVLLSPEFLHSLAAWDGCVVALDDDATGWAEEPGIEPMGPAGGPARAYVIYTSGSSGRPKGVEIEHRSLANLVCFYRERLQIKPGDRATLLANPVFDASVADLWPALCSGGTVLVPREELLGDLDGLIAWLASEQVTFCFVPTALGELLLHRPWPRSLALRCLCVGGDELRVRPPPGLPFEVVNSYGPTENTVDSTWSTVSPEVDGRRPPIGRPIANVRAYVLNERLEPVATGEPGELFLGGAQVARGYLHEPGLTQERFLPDPFAGNSAARMYRTGDRVRWGKDGALEFLGRLDDQFQIRGQRVEPGEIEAALLQHPGVREACCRPLVDEGVVRGIEAHVACSIDGGSDNKDVGETLREFLATRLPGWMVPSVYVRHDTLPLTPQGKVDRAALQRAAPAAAEDSDATLRRDSLVRALTGLWHRLLPEAPGGRADASFHELGGDSLQAVKLLLAVEELTGRRLALSTFLLSPTLAGLCEAVGAAEQQSRMPVLALRRQGTRAPLFCLYELWGDVGMYFGLVEGLGPDQPVFAIRSPALHDLERMPDSIESAARQVREWIRRIRPQGTYGLVGYSWGGLLAFEVARQCAEEEGFNPFCALLGTQAPPRRPSLPARLWHFARWLPRWAWRYANDRGQRRQRFLRAASFARRLRENLTRDEPIKLPEQATPMVLAHIALSQAYQPVVSRPVPLHLFRERGSSYGGPHPAEFMWTNYEWDGGWGRWARCRPRVSWLDGNHWTVFKRPHVDHLASALRAALDGEGP